jgi:hypothetical protein
LLQERGTLGRVLLTAELRVFNDVDWKTIYERLMIVVKQGFSKFFAGVPLN